MNLYDALQKIYFSSPVCLKVDYNTGDGKHMHKYIGGNRQELEELLGGRNVDTMGIAVKMITAKNSTIILWVDGDSLDF